MFDYFDRLEWTANSIQKKNQPPPLPSNIAVHLKNLNIDIDHWTAAVSQFSKNVCQFFGHADKMNALKEKGVRRKVKGLAFSRYLYTKMVA